MTKTKIFNYGITSPSSWYRKASCGISSPPPCLFTLRTDNGLGMKIGTESVGNNDGTHRTNRQCKPSGAQARRTDATAKAINSNCNLLVGEDKHNYIARWFGDNLTFGGGDKDGSEHSLQTNNQTTCGFANVA